mgnify:FL=1
MWFVCCGVCRSNCKGSGSVAVKSGQKIVNSTSTTHSTLSALRNQVCLSLCLRQRVSDEVNVIGVYTAVDLLLTHSDSQVSCAVNEPVTYQIYCEEAFESQPSIRSLTAYVLNVMLELMNLECKRLCFNVSDDVPLISCTFMLQS